MFNLSDFDRYILHTPDDDDEPEEEEIDYDGSSFCDDYSEPEDNDGDLPF